MIRTLTQPEIDATWTSIAEDWAIRPDSGWWFPLSPTARDAVIAFEAAPFHSVLGATWLRQVTTAHGTQRVLYFPEFSDMPVVETDVIDAAFEYAGAEGYWCDAHPEMRDWIVYASHEDSVTLGGAWLVRQAQDAWPEWRAHLWSNDPASFRPPAT